MRLRFIPAFLVFAAAISARAQDRFEIQVYDAETAPRGGVGLELHINVVADGTRDSFADGALPTHHVGHVTLEPHLGLTRWLELGAYIQTAVRPDGLIDFAGWKLRLKSRLPRRFAADRIGLALNIELSVVPPGYEPNQYGSELRPVIDFRWRRLYASINPIVSIDLAGPLAGKPQLDPAAKIGVLLVADVTLGAEYYAAFGPVTGFDKASQQSHRLFAVLDWILRLKNGNEFGANLGVGYNLVGNGDRFVVKAIVGIGR